MSYDGLAEMNAVLARLAPVAGGRILEGVQDDETHARFVTDGGVKPYIIVITSTPQPIVHARSMDGNDSNTPHAMLVTVAAYAGNSVDARITLAAADALMRDWAPMPSALPFTGAGGFQGKATDVRKKPSRFSVGSSWKTTINLGPDA